MHKSVADLLTETGCYINTVKTGESPILLPDGSQVPVYLSCRCLLSYTEQRSEVADLLAELIRQKFPNINLVCGIATAGIGWAYAVAERLNLPMAYVRSSKKSYGITKLVDGNPTPNSQAVLIDDVIFSGKSALQAIDALRLERNIEVAGVVGIVGLHDNTHEHEQPRLGDSSVSTLVSFFDLLESATSQNLIDKKEEVTMRDYYTHLKEATYAKS